jgi:hypothetical protein
MGHNGCYHPYARAIENNFLGPISGENPTNGITNSTNFPPFMRNQLDRLCSLFNLANPAVRKPPPSLPIKANARRDKNNGDMTVRGSRRVNSIPIKAKYIEAKDQMKSQKQLPMLDQNLLTNNRLEIPIQKRKHQ